MSEINIIRLFDERYFVQQLSAAMEERDGLLESYRHNREHWHLSPHPLFDGRWYLDRNPDVRAADVNPLEHYLRDGGHEGRDPHPCFDARLYKQSYLGDSVNENPLLHYLDVGAAKGYLPYAHFNYQLYRELVDPSLSNEAILIDFVANYFEKPQQVFAQQLIQRALLSKTGSLDGQVHASIPSSKSKVDLGWEVVIPVKDSVHWVFRSIEAVLKTRSLESLKSIVIIDDGSSVESLRMLNEMAAAFESESSVPIRVVTNYGQHGFAAACNLGMKQTTEEFVMLLNSDCLLSPDSAEVMLEGFREDPSIGIISPLSNNGVELSLPLIPGCSFIDINDLIKTIPNQGVTDFPEVCTVVGHCLFVSRSCYEAVGGMDESWGLGYGEESDFHLRARARGYLGVVARNAYVYHYAGGTFKNLAERATLQANNHRRFMEYWGEVCSCFYRTAALASPVPHLTNALVRMESASECDVLFILPGLTKGVGGIQIVVDLTNYLIVNGIKSRILILGQCDREALATYSEPMYFAPLHAPTERELLFNSELRPRIVVSTLFATVPACYKFATKVGARLVNFVQGYEFYFDNGIHYEQVRDSFHLAEKSIATSHWLAENVQRQAPSCIVEHCPLGIDTNLFYPDSDFDQGQTSQKLRVGVVLRAAPDKGQFILREMCDQLKCWADRLSLTIFLPGSYQFDSPWTNDPETRLVKLPCDRTLIARELRLLDIFVDGSLHEGYGLLPLEAMASGACVIASASGGVEQFLEDNVNGLLVHEVNQPASYLDKIALLMDDRRLLTRLRQNACKTVLAYRENHRFSRYAEVFKEMLVSE